MPRITRRVGRFLAALIVVAGITAGGWMLYNSSLLSIKEVRVEGTETIAPASVALVADLEGESLLNPDFDGARARVAALPLVKDVSISRSWPDGVTITVVERAPWGVWQVGDLRLVIDDEGVVLDALAPEGAPVIVQTDAAAVPAPGDHVDRGAVTAASRLVATAAQTLGRSVTGLEFSQANGLTAVLADRRGASLRATFGDHQGYDFKIATLYALIRQAEEEGRALRQVDHRFGDRVAVRWGAAR